MSTENSPGTSDHLAGAMSGDAGAATSSSRGVPETADVLAYALSEEELLEFAAHEQVIKRGLSYVRRGRERVGDHP